MRAIRQYEFGPPETLRYEQVDDPIPHLGQVRIAVEAAGVHHHLFDLPLERCGVVVDKPVERMVREIKGLLPA